MIYGLDLFSGIGGISIALNPWVRTVAYCEQDRYAQSVLLSRMSEGKLHRAPIWDDVQTLTGKMLPAIDIIFGGFPCQDISSAGFGAGLAGKRSGLFFQIVRLTKETRAPFVFLENVPAIRTRGLREVIGAFTEIGYDCRWTCLSAASLGAPHRRERWFMLAFDTNNRKRGEVRGIQEGSTSEPPGIRDDVADSDSVRKSSGAETRNDSRNRIIYRGEKMGNTPSQRLSQRTSIALGRSSSIEESQRPDWWAVEPNVGRVAHGIPFRSHRIKRRSDLRWNHAVPKAFNSV